MTVQEALIKAQKQFKKNKISSAGIDAEILLLEAMGKKQKTKNKKQKIEIDKAWLYARPEYELNKNRQKKFEGFIKQRLEGKPIAYIISVYGWKPNYQKKCQNKNHKHQNKKYKIWKC